MKLLVNLTYEVTPERVADGPAIGVLAPLWGKGHRVSVWDRGRLIVLVRVKAESQDHAVALVDAKVRSLWPQVGSGRLIVLSSWAAPDRVPAGVRVRRTPRWQAAASPSVVESSTWFDDGPDDDGFGGTAGVREPRRPNPPPGHLSAALDVPGS